MGMPSVQISFSEKAITAVQRGNHGIVALLLKDKSVQKITESDSGATTDVEVVEIETATDIPLTISEENQKQIAAFLQRHPEFAVCAPDVPLPAGMTAGEYGCLSVPTRTGMDGFFLCVLQKATGTQ